MANLTPSDLRDPQPPVPGERERALVAARAHQLGRRRRIAQGAGALALIAAMAVSVAALTAGGSSGPGTRSHVEAAAPGSVATTPTTQVTAPSTTVAAAPVTTVAPSTQVTPPATEAPTVSPQVAPPVVPASPTTFTLSGTVTGNPSGTTVTLTFSGPGGPFQTNADGAGNFSVSGLTAGSYSVIGEWYDGTGTAGRAQKLGSVTIAGDTSASFTMTA